MVIHSCQQLRHIRSSAVPPDFFVRDGFIPMCLRGWCGRASSLPLQKGVLGWSSPLPSALSAADQHVVGCSVRSAELVQLSQQFQLLLLLTSQVLDFPVSDTLGLDFTEEAFLNGFLFDLLF